MFTRFYADIKWQKLLVASLMATPLVVFEKPSSNLNDLPTNDKISIKQWNYNWDYLGLSETSKSYVDDSKCHNIILIRHGNYFTDVKRREEKKLTDLGRKQASLTGKRLKEFNIKFDNIICSTMVRAKETLELILEEFNGEYNRDKDVEYDNNISEGPPFVIEPSRHGNNTSRDFQLFRNSCRIETGFRSYVHRAEKSSNSTTDSCNSTNDDQYSLLVCHGNVIRYFLCRVLQLPEEAWLRFAIHHGSITWLKLYPDGRVQVKCYSDASFMPTECISHR